MLPSPNAADTATTRPDTVWPGKLEAGNTAKAISARGHLRSARR